MDFDELRNRLRKISYPKRNALLENFLEDLFNAGCTPGGMGDLENCPTCLAMKTLVEDMTEHGGIVDRVAKR